MARIQPLYYTMTEKVNLPGTIIHNCILMRKKVFYKTLEANSYGKTRMKSTNEMLKLVKFERDQ